MSDLSIGGCEQLALFIDMITDQLTVWCTKLIFKDEVLFHNKELG